MFDSYIKGVMDKLTAVEGTTVDSYRAIISDGYLAVVKLRTEVELSEEEITHNIQFLRKLADSFELLGVFRQDVDKDVQTAACFVAAESLDLLTKLVNVPVNEKDSLDSYEISIIESALLYLIAGYDANAATASKKLKDKINQEQIDPCLKWMVNQIISLCDGIMFVEEAPEFHYEQLAYRTRAQIFINLGNSAKNYLLWLMGEQRVSPEKILEELQELVNLLIENHNSFYALCYHLAKMLIEVIKRTKERSILHNIPAPESDDGTYLQFLKDLSAKGKLFYWPSASLFIKGCLPGPHSHGIVTTPTGSGKSTIASLAISQALYEGWVLYIAPTNALVSQIQRDLRKISWHKKTEIRGFIGFDEYTALESEVPGEENNTQIIVMTPEKCALALRLNPEFFKACRLCVFDEFHEINSKKRGITIDMILGILLTISPKLRMLLVSAMIANPTDIKKWLEHSTGFSANIVDLKWKPTRSMRGVVGVSQNDIRAAIDGAVIIPPARSKKTGVLPYMGLFGLQGAWQSTDTEQYRYGTIGLQYKFEVTNRGANFTPWVNDSMKQIAYFFGSKGVKTIGFFPKNKHYPFSVAQKIPDIGFNEHNWTYEIENMLTIADAELGVPSILRELIKKGVSVHTSLMLEIEKTLSEVAFSSGLVNVMFATSTLAQGLNLPAEVVLLGGTELGDEYHTWDETTQARKTAQFLNSVGRAGRAQFASQGLALIIPSGILKYDSGQMNLLKARTEAWFLSQEDASVKIESPLESFIDQIINDSIDPEFISEEELSITPFFSDGSPIPIESLDNTFAAYTVLKDQADVVLSDQARPIIATIHKKFIDETDAPPWILSAARKSGLSFFVMQEMVSQMNKLSVPTYAQSIEINLDDWRIFLVNVLTMIKPSRIKPLIFSFSKFTSNVPYYFETIDGDSEIVDIRDWIQRWTQVNDHLEDYNNSRNIKELAQRLFNLQEVPSKRTMGAAIPKTLNVLDYNGPFEKLSRYAGGIVSILEEKWKSDIGQQTLNLPLQLSFLPIAIKFGLPKMDYVVWFRYACRNRFGARVLGDIFPIPAGIELKEEKLMHWTRNKSKELMLDPENLFNLLIENQCTETEANAILSLLTFR
jgi:hypothetical protein